MTSKGLNEGDRTVRLSHASTGRLAIRTNYSQNSLYCILILVREVYAIINLVPTHSMQCRITGKRLAMCVEFSLCVCAHIIIDLLCGCCLYNIYMVYNTLIKKL